MLLFKSTAAPAYLWNSFRGNDVRAQHPPMRTRALRTQPVAMQQGWPVASRVLVARKERQTYAKRFRRYKVTERTPVYRLVRLYRAGRQTQPQCDFPTDFCFLMLTPGTLDRLSSQTSDGLGFPAALLGEPRCCFPLQPGRPAARGATLQPHCFQRPSCTLSSLEMAFLNESCIFLFFFFLQNLIYL